MTTVVIVSFIASRQLSCLPSERSERLRPVSIDQVLHSFHHKNERITTLVGEGTITFESSDRSLNSSFNLALRKPDSLLLDLTGPFGIHFGSLLLCREKLFFYNRLENVVTVGRSNAGPSSVLPTLHLGFDEILQSFTGEIIYPLSTDSLQSIKFENNQYIVRYNSPGGTKEYRVDGETLLVLSYRLLNQTGKPTLTVLASNSKNADGTLIPRLIRIILPPEREALTIEYEGVHINTPVTCSLTFPAEAEIIYH